MIIELTRDEICDALALAACRKAGVQHALTNVHIRGSWVVIGEGPAVTVDITPMTNQTERAGQS